MDKSGAEYVSGQKRYLGVVEDAASVVRPDHGVLPVLAEVGGGDESRLPVHLVPQRHLLVWNVPQPQLPVQRAAQEVPVVLGRNRKSVSLALPVVLEKSQVPVGARKRHVWGKYAA